MAFVGTVVRLQTEITNHTQINPHKAVWRGIRIPVVPAAPLENVSICVRRVIIIVRVRLCVYVCCCYCADECLQAALCVERRKSKWEIEGERDAGGAQKTTLSKEGFKDYQLRLLGNLRSCILSTSKGRCVLEYCKWERGEGGGEAGEWGGGESDFSNKCWHQACLILDSGNSLICYRLWNSSDVLQRSSLSITTPWVRERRAESVGPEVAPPSSYTDDHKRYRSGVTPSDSLAASLSKPILNTLYCSIHSSMHLKKGFKQPIKSIWLVELCTSVQRDSTVLTLKLNDLHIVVSTEPQRWWKEKNPPKKWNVFQSREIVLTMLSC